MTYRIEIYRPHLTCPGALFCSRTDGETVNHEWLRVAMRSPRDAAFALVIRIDGDEETVLERWRVSADGRILRAVYDVRERELEQT